MPIRSTISRSLSDTKAVLGLVAAIWAVSLVNLVLGGPLDGLGIRPRSISGAFGIVLAPFLHGSMQHLLYNTMPMLVLGGLLCLRGAQRFWATTALVVVAGGTGVWLLGRGASHIGASGLVFGYFGYLLAVGWWERKPLPVVIAVVTAVLYSGLIFGVLPLRSSVSWESHLFGLLAGVTIAYTHAQGGRRAAYRQS
ncbi:MAG: rhomboid family intramembrane serine protease [Gammaproteobacteria bacterium]